MSRPIMLAGAIVWLLAACGPRAVKTEQNQPAREGNSPSAQAEPDLSPLLAELTQSLRKFSAEQRRVPQSLNELVAAGYVKNIPPAPAGQAFFIDQKHLKVGVR